jgi:threonine dehydrogenase-like Zn-dependent dehydrogenase
MGAQRGLDVHVLDHHESLDKKALVRELGGTFHASTLDNFDSFRPDILMECTGAPIVVRDTLGRTSPGGIVCLVGVSAPGQVFSIDVGQLDRTMVLDNDTMFGSVNANRAHYNNAVDTLQRADKAWLARLITRRVPVEQWIEALDQQPDDIKVVVDFS